MSVQNNFYANCFVDADGRSHVAARLCRYEQLKAKNQQSCAGRLPLYRLDAAFADLPRALPPPLPLPRDGEPATAGGPSLPGDCRTVGLDLIDALREARGVDELQPHRTKELTLKLLLRFSQSVD